MHDEVDGVEWVGMVSLLVKGQPQQEWEALPSFSVPQEAVLVGSDMVGCSGLSTCAAVV